MNIRSESLTEDCWTCHSPLNEFIQPDSINRSLTSKNSTDRKRLSCVETGAHPTYQKVGNLEICLDSGCFCMHAYEHWYR